MTSNHLGRYLTLEEFCTCTQTYRKYADHIAPFPQNPDETIPALEALCQYIMDPVIDKFGREHFQPTYGFCSVDLKRWLAKKDPMTGVKNGKVSCDRDQHMAHEKNRNDRYFCSRLGAACDFRIVGLPSDELVEWILAQRLPFDSLYFYGAERPIHISYGPQHKRDIWAFTERGVPTRKGIEHWVSRDESRF